VEIQSGIPNRSVCYLGSVRGDVVERPSALERIMETASALFYAEGIHAVGVDRVTQESGVAKATLYQKFRSKEELVAACLRQRSAHWRQHVAEPVLSSSGSPSVRIARVFDILGRGFSTPDYRGCPFINAAAEYPGRTGPVAAAIRSHRAEVRNLFADLLAPLPASLRRRALVDELLFLYDGMMISAQLDSDSRPQRTARQAAKRLLESRVASN
jgi:AcrR family transcriptional regulator